MVVPGEMAGFGKEPAGPWDPCLAGDQGGHPVSPWRVHFMSSPTAVREIDAIPGIRRIAPSLIATLLLAWVIAIAVGGVVMAIQPFGTPLSAEPPRNAASRDMVIATAIVVLACLATALVARKVRPAAALPALLMVAAVLFVAVAAASGSLASLCVVVVGSALSWLIGEAICGLATANAAPRQRIAVAFALGVGFLGLVWLLLALAGQLNQPAVLLTSGAALVLALTARQRHWGRLFSSLRHLRPAPLSWYETVVVALVVGLITFAMLSTFVPENQSDATRQHLPIAREIWQSGAIGVFEPMSVSHQSIQGHLLFAVAYGFGDMTAAKLLQAMIGLASILGVASIAGYVAGRSAAIAGAAIFATMPIILWELGHAFIDLFPVLFTVSAVLCMLFWQADGHLPWLFLAGALAGVGFATKLNMALVLIALGAALFLVGRGPWRWRDRLLAVVALGVGALVITPWIYRNLLYTGTFPGIGIVMQHVPNLLPFPMPQPGAAPSAVDLFSPPSLPGDSVSQEFGHSLGDLIGIPWFLTFFGKDLGFPIIGRGEIGVALLMLLPFGLLAPRNRATALLGAIALGSYVTWWLTPFQITRHLLPTLAIAAAICGIGVTNLTGVQLPERLRRPILMATHAGLLLAILLTPFFFLPSPRTQMPIDLLVGEQSAEAYIAAEYPAALALAAATDQLPPDTPVAYFGGNWEAPQLYTESRLIAFPPASVGAEPEEVLRNLNSLGVRYLIWNREESLRQDWRSTLLSTPFLRNNARILAGDNNAYLIEILPESGSFWGVPALTNLLEDAYLKQVRGGKGAWKVEGKPLIAQGIVAVDRRDSLLQTLPVTPGHAYVLQAPVRCLDELANAVFGFQWLDKDGEVIGEARDDVVPGREVSEQFSWRVAPPRAASVRIELAMNGGDRCEFSAAALNDLAQP